MSQKKFRMIRFTISLSLLGAVSLLAQMPEAEIHKRLDFIYNGQAERVRIELPSLEKQYPNDAGVQYLDAILTTDGAAAVKKFQTMYKPELLPICPRKLPDAPFPHWIFDPTYICWAVCFM